MRTIYFLAIFCSLFAIQNLVAQELPKIDLYTKRMLASDEWKWHDINLLVRGDSTAIKGLVEQAGGYFKFSYVGINSVNIPVDNLQQFLSDPAVIEVQNLDVPVTLLTDSAAIVNHVVEVHNGDSPLMQPYKGDGVVVGVIDDGIDFRHLDFRKANGDTRIRYLWDQSTNTVQPPLGYPYGREWTEQDINNGICTHVERIDAFGHGSHVTGAAAGNGSAIGKFAGMAPEAELVVVAFNYNRPFLAGVVDGVEYIFRKADAMGKPCVINASLGTYLGSRDGLDLAAQLIDALLDERGGRAMVAAAGNAGQYLYHLGYEVTADTNFTYFLYNTTSGDLFFQLWADSADFSNVKFAFGADDPANNYASLGRTDFLNVLVDYPSVVANGGSLIRNYSLNSGVNFIGSIETQLTKTNGVYLFEAIIEPNNAAHFWRFITTGSGTFDIWSSKALMNFSDMVEAIPSAVFLPDSAKYKYPDTHKTVVSSFTCSDHVLAVGNYVYRSYYIDVYDDTVICYYPKGDIFREFPNPTSPNPTVFLGSSLGPSRDNRIKPDIAAPGTYVLATGNSIFINNAINSGNVQNYQKVVKGGKHVRNSGTSMASPMVTGAVALYLEKNPTANWREIKDAFLTTTTKDAFTTQQPNNTFGYGKLNAFAAIQTNFAYGCTDTAALNYDPNANVNDGSCIQVVSGCMDPIAVNYNPLANFDNGSCQYDTTISGIANVLDSGIGLGVYPNPSEGNFYIVYQLPQAMPDATVTITDLLGKEVMQLKIVGTQGKLAVQALPKGVYLYALVYQGRLVKPGKLIVQ
jgi:subtilisin family serine protease